MYLLLSQLVFKLRLPPLRPSQYSAAGRNTPVWIPRRRRKSQTSEKYYLIMYSWSLYLYVQIIHTIPRPQIHDGLLIPPLESRLLVSVSGPCTRVVSHCPIMIRSGPVSPLPRTRPMQPCTVRLPTKYWTDLPHTPLRRNVVARSHRWRTSIMHPVTKSPHMHANRYPPRSSGWSMFLKITPWKVTFWYFLV